MTVFVLIREDQNEHGYVDTFIAGVFHNEQAAREHEAVERQNARDQGLIVEDDNSSDSDWQVCWTVEEYAVS